MGPESLSHSQQLDKLNKALASKANGYLNDPLSGKENVGRFKSGWPTPSPLPQNLQERDRAITTKGLSTSTITINVTTTITLRASTVMNDNVL